MCGVDRESYGSDRCSVLVLTGVFKFLFLLLIIDSFDSYIVLGGWRIFSRAPLWIPRFHLANFVFRLVAEKVRAHLEQKFWSLTVNKRIYGHKHIYSQRLSINKRECNEPVLACVGASQRTQKIKKPTKSHGSVSRSTTDAQNTNKLEMMRMGAIRLAFALILILGVSAAEKEILKFDLPEDVRFWARELQDMSVPPTETASPAPTPAAAKCELEVRFTLCLRHLTFSRHSICLFL
jgi:hypothetical protein